MGDEKLERRFVEILGAARVRTDEKILDECSQEMCEIEPRRPLFVVRPDSVEQVQAIMAVAAELKVPLTPRVAGTNLGGLTIPAPGGITVDLRDMNRIHAVDEGEMYAIIEPGVTFGDMREYLLEHHPSLRMGYPLAPPEVSIVGNCLCQGLANLSLRHGSMDEWLNGVEAVLPTGEVVRTGSMAVSTSAFSRVPLPDLTGLFVGFQGTTGIVTKAAVELYPEMPARWRGFILNHSLEGTYKVIRDLARLDICDDMGGISWPAGKMMFGVKNPTVRDPGEPEFFLYLDISGLDEEHLGYKRRVVDKVIEEARSRGFEVEAPLDIPTLVQLNDKFSQFADFPTRLGFLLDHEGGGLTWVGLYGPASKWESASRKGEEIMAEHGLPPTIVSRPMKGGHFCVLRFISLFDKKSPEEIDNVRSCQRKLARMSLDEGFVLYKTPRWVIEEFYPGRVDPGLAALVKKVRGILDPAGIMNPDKLLMPT